MKLERIQRATPTSPRQAAADQTSVVGSQPADAAARFAAACATLPDARVHHDVVLDEVSLRFGARTQEVHDRLHALGCRVKLSQWGARKVLRFAFAGRGFGADLAQELANVVKLALGEMHVADTRAW
jgi:hypothetical protein